ncbi:MAG: hypothetical protein OXK72_06835 [Gammaproteobacteria bacterium]|nr:hypothetical protein [Gammaproteobacteria bacterium]
MVEQDKNEEDMLEAVRESVDFSIVADNIVGIADYVIEKHEYRSGQTLSPEMRSAVVEKIKEVLWHQAEGLKLKRMQILQEIFHDAEKALDEVVSSS